MPPGCCALMLDANDHGVLRPLPVKSCGSFRCGQTTSSHRTASIDRIIKSHYVSGCRRSSSKSPTIMMFMTVTLCTLLAFSSARTAIPRYQRAVGSFPGPLEARDTLGKRQTPIPAGSLCAPSNCNGQCCYPVTVEFDPYCCNDRS